MTQWPELLLLAAATLPVVAAEAPPRVDAITWLSSDTGVDSGRPRARIGDTLVSFLDARLPRLPRNAAGEVELERLLADPALRGALIDGRSYGAFLDRTIAARPRDAALKRYGERDFGSQMLGMLAADRADWAIEYDISLRQSPEAERLTAALQSVPIAGASDPMIAGIACPRTPWGLAAIRRVDAVLGTPAGAQMLREALERWTTPEVRSHYAAQIEAFYRERARPAVIR